MPHFNVDRKAVENAKFVPSQREVKKTHPPFPQTHDPNLDRRPPPPPVKSQPPPPPPPPPPATRFPPRKKKQTAGGDFQPSPPEKSRSKASLIDFAKPNQTPRPNQQFKDIFDAQRSALGGGAATAGGNATAAVGFQKFSMNGVEVEFDMMGEGEDATGGEGRYGYF